MSKIPPPPPNEMPSPLSPAAVTAEAVPPLPPAAVTAEATLPLPSAASAATSDEPAPPQYCRIIYNTYQQPFPLTNGLLTAAEIDDEYCFSVVMPGCAVRLSKQGPAEFTRLAQKKAPVASAPSPFGMPAPAPTAFAYVGEEPRGTFVGLEPGTDYFAYVDEAPARRAADEALKAAQLVKLAEAHAADVAKHPGPAATPEVHAGEYSEFDQQYAEFGGLEETWGGPPEHAPGEEPGSSGASMAAGITGGGGITVGAAGWR